MESETQSVVLSSALFLLFGEDKSISFTHKCGMSFWNFGMTQ